MSVWIASMRDSENWKWLIKAWFSYVGKIPDDRGFYFLPIVPDISDNHHNSVSNSTNEFGRKWKVRKKLKLAWWDAGAHQFGGLVMSEIHRRRPRRYKLEFSFVQHDRQPSQKSGTRRENRNAPDSPYLSPSIPDYRGYLRFRVFISRHNLGQLGNSKIPDHLGFSRHVKTRLKNTVQYTSLLLLLKERNCGWH